MTDKANATEEHRKTPLEQVHETQEHQHQTLAAGRAQAEGHSATGHAPESEEARVDTSPDVVGGGPPSTARNFPQRRNQSHGQ